MKISNSALTSVFLLIKRASRCQQGRVAVKQQKQSNSKSNKILGVQFNTLPCIIAEKRLCCAACK